MQRLEGKVAVVSGTGSGIGQACALLFAREGARVVGADINPETAAATLRTAQAEGLRFDSVHPVDLRVPEAAQKVIDTAVELHGTVDILVNAAASAEAGSIEDIDLESQWRATLAAELDSVLLMTRAAWPHLKNGGGAVLNFASVIAWMAIDLVPFIAHAAGKGGVLAMTRMLAREGGPHAIRANTISPGFIVTGPGTSAAAQDETWGRYAREKSMLNRFGAPNDIAYAALYLCSDEASFVTAADFRIDGGWTAW